MQLRQCQDKAKKIGYDKAKFTAFFPNGPVECQWVDAYMGVFKMNHTALPKDTFVLVSDVDRYYQDLIVTEPWVE